jgi:DNA mismatch endonuclease (patch repair protein)
VTDAKRSANMRAVRCSNTRPEKIARSAAHSLGLRFRLFRTDLPGRPDLTFPRWRTVLFVNGCFWHQHEGCPKSRLPRTNTDFWQSKLSRNALRDEANFANLSSQGWRVLILWECEIRNVDAARAKIAGWFSLSLNEYARSQPVCSSCATSSDRPSSRIAKPVSLRE